MNGNVCVNMCPDSKFVNTTTNTCDACDSTCATCYSPNGPATRCLSCPNNFYLNGEICVSVCPNGKYANSQSNQCDSCDQLCNTC